MSTTKSSGRTRPLLQKYTHERLRFASTKLLLAMNVFGAFCSTAWSSECPVELEFDRKSLVLYPAQGPEFSVALPPGLTMSFGLIASSANGEALYGSGAVLDGIVKIEFQPLRQTIVPGSAGLGKFSGFTLASTGGRIFVSGSTIVDGRWQCGDYEVDPSTGTRRSLRAGTYPDCGGPVSPDGKRELHSAENKLSVLELRPVQVTLLDLEWPQQPGRQTEGGSQP